MPKKKAKKKVMAKKRGGGHQGQGGVLVAFAATFDAESELILVDGDCAAYPDEAKFFACVTYTPSGAKARAELGIPPWGTLDTGIPLAPGASAVCYVEAVTAEGELLGRSIPETVTDV